MEILALLVLIYIVVGLVHWYVLDRNQGKFSSLYIWISILWLPLWIVIGVYFFYMGLIFPFRKRKY